MSLLKRSDGVEQFFADKQARHNAAIDAARIRREANLEDELPANKANRERNEEQRRANSSDAVHQRIEKANAVQQERNRDLKQWQDLRRKIVQEVSNAEGAAVTALANMDYEKAIELRVRARELQLLIVQGGPLDQEIRKRFETLVVTR